MSLTEPNLTIDPPIDASPTLSTDGMNRLDPSARWAMILGNAVGTAILSLFLAGFAIWIGYKADVSILPLLSIGAATFGLMVLASMGYALLSHRHFGYLLREHDLIVQSGVWFRSRRCIPRSKVQHINIDSGPILRSFNLVSVHVFVAGGMGEVAQIPGLPPQAADELRAAVVVDRGDDV
jgi:uncharacterized protein